MKKILYCLIALSLGAASCSQDSDLTFEGETATVAFTVNAPDALTRAGEGGSVDMLKYAVYDITDGGRTLFDSDTENNVEFPMSLNLQLITGHEYGVLFWAGNSEAPYSIDFDNGELTVEYANAYANSEALDGFYAYETLSLSGNMQMGVTMNRPFAMVNVGVSEAPAAGSESAITIQNAATGINLITGELLAPTASATFQPAAVPQDAYPVQGYSTLAYAYVLAPSQGADYTVSYQYTAGSASGSNTVVGVALQANYRTNIYGSLPSGNNN